MKRELLLFGCVGISALLMHFVIVSLWLVPAGLPPLAANVAAFLLAFQVSYWGHRCLTFQAHHVPHRQALPRFFGVASLSFALNEALYFVLLRFTPLDYRSALLLVLLLVALFTFLLSKWWAFAGKRPA